MCGQKPHCQVECSLVSINQADPLAFIVGASATVCSTKLVSLALITWLIVATGGSAIRLHITRVLHGDMGECERAAWHLANNAKADESLG